MRCIFYFTKPLPTELPSPAPTLKVETLFFTKLYLGFKVPPPFSHCGLKSSTLALSIVADINLACLEVQENKMRHCYIQYLCFNRKGHRTQESNNKYCNIGVSL